MLLNPERRLVCGALDRPGDPQIDFRQVEPESHGGETASADREDSFGRRHPFLIVAPSQKSDEHGISHPKTVDDHF